MYAGIRWWTVLLLVLVACGDDSGARHPPDAPRENEDAEVDAPVIDAEIDAMPDAPPVVPAMAANDLAAMLEDGAAIEITPLANDTVGSAGTLAITSYTQPTNGSMVRTDDTFTYSPPADFNGTDSFTYSLDGGSTATVSISVGAVNDSPGFTKGADQTVLQGSGMTVVANWATAISAGPANEVLQTLTFTLVPGDAALFAVAPSVDADGTLSFMPAPGAHGTTTVTVTLSDDAGTDSGGVDTAAPQTFVILIKAPA